MIDARDPLDVGEAAAAVENPRPTSTAGRRRRVEHETRHTEHRRARRQAGSSSAATSSAPRRRLERWPRACRPSLDDWHGKASKLAQLSAAGAQPAGAPPNASCIDSFDPPTSCASPLPRAYQWADGSAYVNHVELVRKARGAEMPATFWTDPLMYQGGSDSLPRPARPDPRWRTSWGIDLEAEVAVITDDVPMGVSRGGAGPIGW